MLLDGFCELVLPGRPGVQVILVEPDSQASFARCGRFLKALLELARCLRVRTRMAQEQQRSAPKLLGRALRVRVAPWRCYGELALLTTLMNGDIRHPRQ